MENNNYGIKTSGDDLNWRNLNNNHEDDPVVSALVKDSENIFSETNINDNAIVLNNELISEFSNFLLDNKLGSYFEELVKTKTDETDKNKKNKSKSKKKQNINKKDLIKLNIDKEKNKKEIQKFLSSLKLENYYPLKKNKLHESFLSIIYWACFLIKNYKHDYITTEILCDCSISLFRAINDCKNIINDDIKDICMKILDKLENYLNKKNKNHVYELLSKYYYLITSSLWDDKKPNNIVLYEEQKIVIRKIIDSIKNDNPLLLFYWVPPANGKTLVSTIIAKTISNYYKELRKDKYEFYDATIVNFDINEYDGPFLIKYDDGTSDTIKDVNMIRPTNAKNLKNKNINGYQPGMKIQAQKIIRPKILLYICYNDIVRNSVSTLCVTHNVDIKFWLATYRQDKYDNTKYLVDFRPYKNCFPDWRKKKSARLFKKDEINVTKRYSEDLRVQMYQYLDETRLIDVRENELNLSEEFHERYSLETCENLPEMIISDLDSAYELLKEFPDMFIPYFDEAFAASNQGITAKIMSVLPKTSVLVSATLARPDKIPTILSHFKSKHNGNDDSIQYVQSNKQHINCEFISPDGDLISPYHNLENSSEIQEFLELIEKNPIIERGFSNLIVLSMFEKLKDDLPESDNLLFVNHLGNITNANIRDYGKKLLKFCIDNDRYFDKIKKIKVPRISDNNMDNIFTKNAYIYHQKNTLHVSNPDKFLNYVKDITRNLLDESPNLKKIISIYKSQRENIEKEIKNIEKNVKADLKDTVKSEAEEKLAKLKFKYPTEYIMNSGAHFKKFHSNKILSQPENILFNSEVINNFEDFMAKLYLSGIGVYNQSDLSSYELEVFLKYKDKFRFIISDPSIIYGTNINLTMIDIHESLAPISTRNTIYQLMGRGGRFGKSSSAVVNFRSWDLFNIVVANNDINEEATNIENNLIQLLE